MLRGIFGRKRDEVTGEWRKLHNEELNDLYCSPNIVRVIKSGRPMLIFYSHLCLGLPIGLFLSGFPTKTLYMPLISPYVLHVPPISFSILSPEKYWVSSTEH